MAGLFKRIFRVAQAEAHAAVDKLEDPVKMTEQGIRELKQKFCCLDAKPCTSQSLCDSS
jgi:phage shock protein A